MKRYEQFYTCLNEGLLLKLQQIVALSIHCVISDLVLIKMLKISF